MSTGHTASASPDPCCGMCGGEGWVVGAEYMGAVERVPCECIGRPHEDDSLTDETNNGEQS